MDIVQNRMGVPSLVEDDGTIIYLQNSEIDNLQAIDMQDPSVIDSLYEHIKKAVAVLAPIDPDLELGDWFVEYNQVALINEFQNALFVMNQARTRALEDRQAYNDEELT